MNIGLYDQFLLCVEGVYVGFTVQSFGSRGGLLRWYQPGVTCV